MNEIILVILGIVAIGWFFLPALWRVCDNFIAIAEAGSFTEILKKYWRVLINKP